MAITFPRDMPSVAALSIYFELERVDFLSPEAGGRLGAVSAGQPLWKMALSLQNMTSANADVWRAWVAAQRGAQRQFYGRDLDRPYPKAHRNGFAGMVRALDGLPFNGSASSWTRFVDADGNERVTLTNLPAGLTLGTGDYIGFRWDQAGAGAGNMKRRALVRVVEGGTTAASGQQTFSVEPSVPLIVPPTAIAHIDNPVCLMRLVPEETQLGEQGLGAITNAGVRVVGLQDLLP